MPNLPEFSNENYNIVGYIVAALITLSGGFLVYEVLFNSDLTFSANWNMFKSPLGQICWGIGFLCAIIFWGKMGHWSATPVNEYRDSSGRLVERKESMDVMDQGFAKILMPVLGHFGIEPLVYGALIYYPIECVIALVGTIFPYFLALIVLAIIVLAWFFPQKFEFRYRSVVLVLAGVFFTAAFAWGGYAIHNSTPGSTIQMLADTQGYSNSNQTEGSEMQATEDTNKEIANEGNAEEEVVDDSVDDQFEGFGEEGLFGCLPLGTTEFIGEMGGFPIELIITKNDNSGDLKALYRNLKYSTTMDLSGESLPSMGGNISLYGRVEGEDWIFNLSGTAQVIQGYVQYGNKKLEVALKKK